MIFNKNIFRNIIIYLLILSVLLLNFVNVNAKNKYIKKDLCLSEIIKCSSKILSCSCKLNYYKISKKINSRTFYIFNENVLSSLSLNKSKVKIEYENLSEFSDYYNTFLRMEYSYLERKDYKCIEGMLSKNKKLKLLYNDFNSSHDSDKFVKMMNILYKKRNLMFKDFNEYEQYLYKIAKSLLDKKIKKIAIVTDFYIN